MHAKISGQYYNSVVATQDAKNRGFDEALLLDRDGYIAEGSGENIFLVRGKTMYTPQSGNLLPGITRDTLFDLAVREGYRVCESHITPKQLARFSEAFFVGTAAEVTPIDSIDTYLFNTGVDAPVTEHIKRRYHELIRGQIRGYSKWLTRVNN
jgi:branched-chain amino acid aminotransferase